MKSVRKILLWSAVSLALIVEASRPISGAEVSIADPGLNLAVRMALGKPSGSLTEADLLGLTLLSAGNRGIGSVEGLEAAHNLRLLDLVNNSLTNFPIAESLTNLTLLDLSGNDLDRFTLSNALPGLVVLDVAFNSLTNFSLPSGCTNLDTLFLEGNALKSLDLPSGLNRLTQLDLSGNSLTNLILPPDLTNLTALFVDENPLITLVLPQSLASSTLAATVTKLQNDGVQVYPYPPVVQLTFPPQQPIGAFRFGITGPPGVYAVYSSTNLTDWSALNLVNNPLGGIYFTDTAVRSFSETFYRAQLLGAPANMVFVSPNSFVMGSATNDLESSQDEHPQTTVILSHGYWIGKFEVTQAEYLSVTGSNPSEFPGDLRRPVSNVTWSDATNYCAKLTELRLATGSIPPGSRYRLPTEAEWECAARAGTTTRFSYGDDPGYLSVTNYAWFLDFAILDLTVHPVAQKLPNPWGLYDMHGNVWEWCQDGFGPLPGGIQMDPTGPTDNSSGEKALRGGAYDYPNSSCRSASRIFRFASWPDSDVGFRVVLVFE